MNQWFPANYWAYLNTLSDDAYGDVVDASATTVEGAVAYGEPYYDYLYGQGFDPRLAGNLGGPWGAKSVTPKGYMYSADVHGGRSASAAKSSTSSASAPYSHLSSDLSGSGGDSGNRYSGDTARSSTSNVRWLSNGLYEPSPPNSLNPDDGVLWDAPENPVLTHISVSSETPRQELVQEHPVFDVQTMSATHAPTTSLHELVEDRPVPLHVMSVSQMVRGDSQMAAAMAAETNSTERRKPYLEVAKLPPVPVSEAADYLMDKRKQDKAVRGVATGDKLDIVYKDKQRKLQAQTAAAEKRTSERQAEKAAEKAKKAAEKALKPRSRLV